MNAVTSVGAPWYASGVHMWNGTAETLNAKPTSRSNIAITSRMSGDAAEDATSSPISSSLVEPVAAYASAMPYRKNALENAPSTKYLNAASAPASLLRLIPVST